MLRCVNTCRHVHGCVLVIVNDTSPPFQGSIDASTDIFVRGTQETLGEALSPSRLYIHQETLQASSKGIRREKKKFVQGEIKFKPMEKTFL